MSLLNVKNIYSFETFIAPKIILVIHGIGLIPIAFASLNLVILDGDEFGAEFGWAFLLICPIVWRLICELLILFFRIYGKLCDIHQELGSPQIPSQKPTS